MKALPDQFKDLERGSRRAAALSFVGVVVVACTLGWSAYHLKKLDATVEQKHAEVAELTRKGEALQVQQKSLSEENAKLEAQASRAVAEIKNLSNTQDELRRSLSEAELKTTEATRKRKDAESELAKVEAALKEKRQEAEAFEKQFKVANNQLEDVHQVVSRETPRENAPLTVYITPRARAEKKGDLFDCQIWLEMHESLLGKIEKVTYTLNHPSFPKEPLESSDPSTGFAVGYRGWGALRLVIISVYPKNGEKSDISFDMAKALGLAATGRTLGEGKIPFDAALMQSRLGMQKIPLEDLSRHYQKK